VAADLVVESMQRPARLGAGGAFAFIYIRSRQRQRRTTSKVRVVVWVIPPPVPVIVIGYVPVGAFLDTDKVKWELPEPGAAIDPGLKVAVTPVGTPLALKVIAESKPPETLVVTTAYPLWP
jgi:hypothetical protein